MENLNDSLSNTTNHLISNKRSTKPSSSNDLVELAQQIEFSNGMVKGNTLCKLKEIVNQMQFLRNRAIEILQEAKKDSDMHNVLCNFIKRPGSIYHVYERSSGEKYLSMISPEEWGPAATSRFLGSYRLETDQSWTEIGEMASRDEKDGVVRTIMQSGLICQPFSSNYQAICDVHKS